MELAHDRCFAALASKDVRFDGRFFAGIETTGIYCRPVCPARTPLAKNVRFFPSAAAAQEAGFRACMRCRPETAPGAPAWKGTAATVTRALRLIDGGALDRGSLPELASRLGLGERQLRRLFAQHVGASPKAVARVRRLNATRLLLQTSELPLSDVAFVAGFSSIRRFNDAVKTSFGRTPTELRAQGVGGRGLTLNLSYRPPLEWGALLSFLKARGPVGVVHIEDGIYARTVRAPDGCAATISARLLPEKNAVEVRVPAALAPVLTDVVRRIRHQFDLDASPDSLREALGSDPQIGASVREAPGLRVPGAFDGFEVAIRAILGQQISVKGATTLLARIIDRWGDPVSEPRPGLTHLFPTPEQLREAAFEEVGIPGARSRALRELSAGVADGRIDFLPRRDLKTTVSDLCALRGFGPWTAHYLAMRVFREPDAFPGTDLVLKRAAADGASETWRPWRSYAAMHLWRTA